MVLGWAAAVVLVWSGVSRGDGDRRAGGPVPDAADEAWCAEAVAALADGDPAATAALGDPLVLGAALWLTLSRADPGLAEAGIPSTFHDPSGGADIVMTGRVFGAGDQAKLVASAAFRDILRRAAAGGAQAADAAERERFYRMIPFDIAGLPLTVVGDGADRLVVQRNDRKVFWLDLIANYWTAGATGNQSFLVPVFPRR